MTFSKFKLETDRLLIRNLSLQDAEAFFNFRAHPAVSKFHNWVPNSLQEAKDFLLKNESNTLNNPGSWFQVAIEEKKSGCLIGDIGIHFLESGNPQCEIGFAIAPTFQGEGYGIEAVMRTLSFLFLNLHKHRVVASVDPQNEPSIRLLEKASFKKEAHFRKSLFFKGSWVDDIVFAILNEDWPRTNEAPSHESLT